jgi:hypothetical protein
MFEHGGLAARPYANRIPAPIVFLPAPGESAVSAKPEQACVLLIEGLKAVAAGRVLDVRKN